MQVVNHVGAISKDAFHPGPQYGPFDQPEDFHPFCLPDDWDDAEQIEQCWLKQEMPDLNVSTARSNIR